MQTAETLPDGLADLPPGPALCAALAGVEVRGLPANQVRAVLLAEYRQLAHQQARVFAAVAEVGLRWPDEEHEIVRLSYPDEFSADEVRAALNLTAAAAAKQLRAAYDLQTRLPQVHAEMMAGRVDEPRSWVFREFTSGLCQEHVDVICAKLLPTCGDLTVPQLIAKIRAMAVSLDPGFAERRHKKAREGRGVVGTLEADGTATITLFGVAQDVGAAISGRLDALARSAKNNGDPRPIAHLHADLSAALQDGTFEGMYDSDILDYLAATRPDPAASPEPHAPRPADPADAIAAWVRSRAARGGRANPAPDPDDPQPDDPEPDDPEPDDPGGRGGPGPNDSGTSGSGPAEGASPEDDSAEDDSAEDDSAEPAVGQFEPASAEGTKQPRREPMEPPRHGVELQARFSTLVGMDDYPAELAGSGPIHPGLARSIAATLDTAQWRYALTGPDGRLLTQGLTPARPVEARRRHCRSRAVLELQIPADLLLRLATAQPCEVDPGVLAAWKPVLADIVRRVGGLEVLTGIRPYPPPDDGSDDPTRRFARAGLRRDVQMRKRRCMGPGCRAPAGKLDLDHTVDHAHGGPTIGFNLWPACLHDHALKTKGGWSVRAIDQDTLEWTSRLGHTYVVKTPPVIDNDLPDPAPDPDAGDYGGPPPNPDTDYRGTPWQEASCWRAPPPPSPRLRYVDLDDEPPPRPRPRYIVSDEPPF